MSNEINDPIYQKAVETFGQAAQKRLLIEECSELITAICHHFRGRATDDQVIEEMVDVQLMLNQMRVLINDESKWERWFAYKLDRLRGLIERHRSVD